MPSPTDAAGAIYAAVRVGDMDGLKKALASETADINYRAPPDQWSPLLRATYDGNEPVIQLLLEAEADLNAASALGRTPLHIAAHCNNLSIARQLITCGADIDSRDIYDRTAMDYAMSYGDDTDLIKFLRVEVKLRENNVERNDKMRKATKKVSTAVELAAEAKSLNGHRSALARLVADKSMWEGNGAPSGAEVVAAIDEEESSSEEEEEEGEDGDGTGAATKVPSPGKERRLSALGDIKEGSNKSIKSAALWASAFGKVRALKAILAVESTVKDETDPVGGNSALHWAVLHRELDTIRVLLEAGADPTVRNRNGESALEIAREMRLREAIAMMEETPKGRIDAERLREQDAALQEIEKSRRAKDRWQYGGWAALRATKNSKAARGALLAAAAVAGDGVGARDEVSQ